MPKLFISYRRDDSEFPAHDIYRKLAAYFGDGAVFIDVDTIPPGLDFRRHLSEAVSQCDILLAIVGRGWLGARSDDGKRRLDDPADFVRIEIEAALSRGVPVIPVLLGRVRMPTVADLPEGLRDLTYRQAIEVRSGRDFDADVDRLIKGISRLCASPAEQQSTASARTAAASAPQAMPATAEALPLPETAARHGEVVTNTIGMKLVCIRAGQFSMGSSDSDEDGGNDEEPQHLVEITKPFLLSVYPVTLGEFEQVMGSRPKQHQQNTRLPVEMVSWFDAIDFCNQLSRLEGLTPYYRCDGDDVAVVRSAAYRLPTEAEWEYACRAGTMTKWSFGDDASQLRDYAWFDENAAESTHPVGQRKPNPWGLHDMHGNVYEWCWDWHEGAFYQQSPSADPTGPTKGEYRVLRGGSFNNQAGDVRSAFRLRTIPTNRFNVVGFRPARSQD